MGKITKATEGYVDLQDINDADDIMHMSIWHWKNYLLIYMQIQIQVHPTRNFQMYDICPCNLQVVLDLMINANLTCNPLLTLTLILIIILLSALPWNKNLIITLNLTLCLQRYHRKSKCQIIFIPLLLLLLCIDTKGTVNLNFTPDQK